MSRFLAPSFFAIGALCHDRLLWCRQIALVVGALLLIRSEACGAADNRFVNASFDAGREPWISLAAPDKPFWHDFSIAADPTDATGHAAKIELDATQATEKSEVWGLLQEVKETATIPRYLHGRYFVAEWTRGTPKQYINVIFNIWATSDNFGTRKDHSAPIPVQVSFILAGITEPPFGIANRRFRFAGPAEPKVGEWVDFEFDLHEALESSGGLLPKQFSGFRVLFEARFDGRAPDEKSGRATVYFDDLYLGDEKRVAIPAR